MMRDKAQEALELRREKTDHVESAYPRGFFESAGSSTLDWLLKIRGDEQERCSLEQLRSADVLLFGRVTYEGVAAYWQSAQGRGRRLHERPAENRFLAST
jgi:dihydrofolate reductase